jgi:hypothetical protein
MDCPLTLMAAGSARCGRHNVSNRSFSTDVCFGPKANPVQAWLSESGVGVAHFAVWFACWASAASQAAMGSGCQRETPEPVENQIRTYSWCNPPRIGRQRIRPALFTVRDRGASLSKAKCVRVSL